MKKKLFIFSNEQVFSQDEKFYCDNIDLKSSPEGLNKKFEVNLFARKSYKKRAHEIKIRKIKIFNNLFTYISSAIAASKINDSKYLINDASHGLKNSSADPALPLLAVRPTRWTYSVVSDGASYWTIQSTFGISNPLAATSVQSNTPKSLFENACNV